MHAYGLLIGKSAAFSTKDGGSLEGLLLGFKNLDLSHSELEQYCWPWAMPEATIIARYVHATLTFDHHSLERIGILCAYDTYKHMLRLIIAKLYSGPSWPR